MTQSRNITHRISQRQKQILLTLYVYGESRLSKVHQKGQFDASKDTLRRELDDLYQEEYVEIDTEEVGGSANPANLYSLTSRGNKYCHTVSVSNKNQTVLERLDDLERKVAELKAENQSVKEDVEWLKEHAGASEHYLKQLAKAVEDELDVTIDSWSPD